MKKFLLSLLAGLAVLVAIFMYVLYSEGFFETLENPAKSDMKPFEMKCEAGKCGGNKCGGAK